jgi:hypothetical protein
MQLTKLRAAPVWQAEVPPCERAEQVEQRLDLRTQVRGQGQLLHAPREGLYVSAPHAEAFPPQQRPDQANPARSASHQPVAHREDRSHVPFLVRGSVCGTVGFELAGLRQGQGIASVRLHPPVAL